MTSARATSPTACPCKTPPPTGRATWCQVGCTHVMAAWPSLLRCWPAYRAFGGCIAFPVAAVWEGPEIASVVGTIRGKKNGVRAKLEVLTSRNKVVENERLVHLYEVRGWFVWKQPWPATMATADHLSRCSVLCETLGGEERQDRHLHDVGQGAEHGVLAVRLRRLRASANMFGLRSSAACMKRASRFSRCRGFSVALLSCRWAHLAVFFWHGTAVQQPAAQSHQKGHLHVTRRALGPSRSRRHPVGSLSYCMLTGDLGARSCKRSSTSGTRARSFRLVRLFLQFRVSTR